MIWLIPVAIVLVAIAARAAQAAPGGGPPPPGRAPQFAGGDIVGDIARAFAHAEGWGIAGAIPTVRNNPGDLRGSDGQITTYATEQAGWDAIVGQVRKILDGTSRIYRPDMPIIQIAALYVTGKPDNSSPDVLGWARTVSGDLGLSISDPLTAYQGTPVLEAAV